MNKKSDTTWNDKPPIIISTPVCLIAFASRDSPFDVEVMAPPAACRTRQTKSHAIKKMESLFGRIHESLSEYDLNVLDEEVKVERVVV